METLRSSKVADNCRHIRQIIANLPADTTEKQLKNCIKKYKCGSSAEGIPSLPSFSFHGYFKNGIRSNENAIPSGLVSIDLDGIDDPREYYKMLSEGIGSLKLALAYISPSTHGIKLVFALPDGATSIPEAQLMIVRQLGVESYFDQGTSDLARPAFAVPEDYVLASDYDLLFSELPVPEGFGKDDQFSEQDLQQAMSEEPFNDVQPQNLAAERFINGVSYAEIIERLCIKLCGQPEPEEGKRNNTLYNVTRYLRGITDDLSFLVQVLPTWGQDATSWMATIRSAFKRDVPEYIHQEVDRLLGDLRREKAIEQGMNTFSLPQPPAVRDLPPVFREYARVVPEELRPAFLLTLLPVLGFHATMIKTNANPSDEKEEWNTPSFITVVTAPPSSGKGNITWLYKDLMREQMEYEQPLLAQLNLYNQKKKPELMPAVFPRILPERLSLTSMSFVLEHSHKKHLMLFTPEIETLKGNSGSGAWNDLSTVFRKAFDNDEVGQLFMSGESRACNVPIYLNMLIEAQPETCDAFFNQKNVINGLNSRVVMVDLPDTTGCRKTKVKRMSDLDRRNVKSTIDYIRSLGVKVQDEEYDEEGNKVQDAEWERLVINLPHTRKKLDLWADSHQNHYLRTQANPAEDALCRRAKAIGLRAALVATAVSHCKETHKVSEFALWVAEYTLQSQLLHFGQSYNELKQKRDQKRIDTTIAFNEKATVSIFDELPSVFTTSDIRSVKQKHGMGCSNPNKTVSDWLKAGFVEEVPSATHAKTWRKLVAA